MPPHPAAKSATSAAALGFPETAVATRPRMAGETAGQAGSKDALARLNAAIDDLKALAIQPLLQDAVAALQGDNFTTGGELAIKALELDEKNGFGWYLLAIARERAGDFASSVRCYESALSLLPDQAEIANDMGRLAYRMGMKETAEKLFSHYLSRHPQSHEGANNLACALRDQGRFADAIEVLRPAIAAHPEHPLLWNTLGTVVGEEGDPAGSMTFFDEALRHDPVFAKARYNRGNARLVLGDPDGALDDVQAAMTANLAEDERLMMLLARSTIRIARGEVGEGWDDYEARLHPKFADTTHFMIEAPQWTPGSDLAGKTLLLMGEQGLGDEVMFANVIPDLIRALGPDGRLLIAVEPRLIPLFQRSFPTAEVGAHSTWSVDGHTVRGAPFVGDHARLDLWAPMASVLRQFRRTVDAYPAGAGFLAPDPARVAYWRAQLPAGPTVGLLWKSLLATGARHRFVSPFEQWKPVLATPGVTFVNLQYGDCAAELEAARRELGVEIWQPPGIDLKQDLDEVAALCGALDLVIGPSNATSCLAGASGAPLWLLSTPGAWPMLGTDRYPWYPQARVFLPPTLGQWEPAMKAMARALAEWSQGGTKA
ncbi:MAG: tetratricopeptide repeat protein [Caulobacterales bacterium]|nr:tetratricopeptide repeat protein [Caulobacterales bacterium]